MASATIADRFTSWSATCRVLVIATASTNALSSGFSAVALTAGRISFAMSRNLAGRGRRRRVRLDRVHRGLHRAARGMSHDHHQGKLVARDRELDAADDRVIQDRG